MDKDPRKLEIKHTLSFEYDKYETLLLDGERINAPIVDLKIISRQSRDNKFYSEVKIILDSEYVKSDLDNNIFICGCSTKRQITDFESINFHPQFMIYREEREFVEINIFAKVEIK